MFALVAVWHCHVAVFLGKCVQSQKNFRKTRYSTNPADSNLLPHILIRSMNPPQSIPENGPDLALAYTTTSLLVTHLETSTAQTDRLHILHEQIKD